MAVLLGLVAALVWLGFGPTARADYAALVVDAATQRVLLDRNADARMYPASLTKMMTLYLVFEALEQGRLGLDDRFTVSANAASQPPTKIGLKAGQTIKVRDAILALVTRSANDVATVIAEGLGGTEPKFGRLMTEKARALGMRDTTFRNASGLPDPAMITTARDMIRLAIALKRDFPSHYKFFSARSFTWKGTTFRNHNHLLGEYKGMDGLKTGFTRAAGWNLAASAERDGCRVVAVILGGESRIWRDREMVGLLDLGFERATAALAPLPGDKPIVAAVNSPALPAAPPTIETILAEVGAGPSEDPPGGWGIQVGAYASAESASRALVYAETILPPAFDSAVALVIEVQSLAAPLYRARYVGVNRTAATQACAALDARGQPCAVVYHRSDSAALGAP
ncbi:MAG: D-alanyl-D-alanine carboxypeptidase [Alphaproteobacteria bacterium]